jgi:hypothetical protein
MKSEEKRVILTFLRFELVLIITMKVVYLFLSFPMHIYASHLDQRSLSYGPRSE